MLCLVRILQRYWKPITLINLVLITTLSLWPLATLPSVPGSDKTHHFIAYAALVLPVAVRRPQGWLLMVVAAIGWSGGIELLQPYVNRYGEWLDLLANGGGVACGVVLGWVLRAMAAGQED